MMRLVVPLVLLLVGIAGGVGAGFMLGGEPTEAVVEDGAEVESEAVEDPAAAPSPSANPARVEPAGVGTEYVRLNNQFIVPIVRDGTVRSLVVLGLTVEVDIGLSGAIFDREPRLRDSFLRVMFAHANAGGFDGTFTEATAMEPLREALQEAAQGILQTGTVHDVLITDITRQDA